MPDNQNPKQQDDKKPKQKAYQNPGKDKDHPGDKAANRAATEPSEGDPSKR
ncbi:hypothetical protein [Rhizobium sp. Leaf386]|uniref:hypothetical protein n=1 Tax=Rhizobium sp. Leaf386 TaxID=1736359 RepID=UPI000AD899DD|nr:hypothetical protein [Rhizobium sp. Leaf386]